MSNELSKARDFAQMIETDNPATRLSKRWAGPGTCDVTNALLCVTFRDMGDSATVRTTATLRKCRMHSYNATHTLRYFMRVMDWDVVQLSIDIGDCIPPLLWRTKVDALMFSTRL